MDSRTSRTDGAGDLLILAFLAPLVGACAGLLGALFRLALVEADRLRGLLVDWGHATGLPAFPIVVVACGLAAGFAAWLVRRHAPYASGSGIPHVEAVLEGRLAPVSWRLIPVKFVGGVLAIGSGLALGREGPTVQMGASLAGVLGTLCRRGWEDRRILIATGAGAGLATAFNAPIAGAIFVLEELVRRFEPRTAFVALGASASAIMVARIMIGPGPDFGVHDLPYPGAAAEPLFLMLGVAAGLLAVIHNRALLAALALADRLARIPAEARAAAIGAAVGVLAWFAPGLVGGGDALTLAAISGAGALALLPALLVLRLALGAASYAAGTPGGLFAPMLVLGAFLGLAAGRIAAAAFPALEPAAFAIVGMAAFFAGAVRAPLTGIVLIIEMTGAVALLLPMLTASFAAMFVPIALRDPPIYESLGKRLEDSPAP